MSVGNPHDFTSDQYALAVSIGHRVKQARDDGLSWAEAIDVLHHTISLALTNQALDQMLARQEAS